VETVLQKPLQRLLALLLALFVASTVVFTAAKMGVADVLNRTSSPENWLRAAQIEPGYGEYWHHLGYYRQNDLDSADPVLATEYYEKAVRTDSRSSRYWLDLASALQQADHPQQARDAFQQAVANFPISAEAKWAFGNFLLLQGDFNGGVAQLRQAVLIDPSLRPLAISRCWQSHPDADMLLDQLLPAQPAAYADALDFFASNQDVDSGIKVWNRLIALKQPFPVHLTFSFFDEMIRQGRAEEGRRMWQQAYDVDRLAYDLPADRSVVWNGGFEHDLADGGFGWRTYGAPGVTIEPDTEVVHSGKRSVRIDFEGAANVDFFHLFQYVAVQPGRKYHFRGWLRTDAITTDSGVRFSLSDQGNKTAGELLTPSVTGTTPWTLMETDIVAGPTSHVLNLQVRRFPARGFDSRIEGTAWVDDVSLIAVDGQSHAAGTAKP
jgi:tetratricopeptide (TPR) repeat protein